MNAIRLLRNAQVQKAIQKRMNRRSEHPSIEAPLNLVTIVGNREKYIQPTDK
ncbi:hypothetical protein E0L35_13845 [Halomonas sp. ATBC28]|nr:hypothetical protein E0L35_13845 [Halomonas sp. ATBC28]